MTVKLTPDICIIGAGSGGLSVAAAAAAFGVDVVLLEKGKMGGDCLNYGCVPSKAIIAAAKYAKSIQDAKKFGIDAGEPKVDFGKVHDHIHSVIGTIAPHDSVERFEGLGVNVIEGAGQFKDANTVVSTGKDGIEYEIKARRFVISTGSSPFVPPISGLDEVNYLTNEVIFDMKEAPKKLIVIGGGPIGMELAQAHRRLGAEVTVVEGFKALGKDDPELTAIALKKIREDGVEILEGAKVVKVAKQGDGVLVTLNIGTDEAPNERAIEGSHLLVATGRAANVNGLGLEAAGIEYSRRGIKVSDKMRTSNKRVYAIGDVAGSLQFTHMAGYQAGLVVRAILFRLPARENTHMIPWATYTDPEIAHIGHTEETAKKVLGDNIKILRWDYSENDRAQAEKKTDGLIKMITRKNGKIEGVSIVGQNAGEMINMWALAISKGMKVKDIAGFVSPYPTMTEIGKRAAITYYADAPKSPILRKLLGFLRIFG